MAMPNCCRALATLKISTQVHNYSAIEVVLPLQRRCVRGQT